MGKRIGVIGNISENNIVELMKKLAEEMGSEIFVSFLPNNGYIWNGTRDSEIDEEYLIDTRKHILEKSTELVVINPGNKDIPKIMQDEIDFMMKVKGRPVTYLCGDIFNGDTPSADKRLLPEYEILQTPMMDETGEKVIGIHQITLFNEDKKYKTVIPVNHLYDTEEVTE